MHHAPIVGSPELSEFAAFFRAPDQRLLSAWFYGKHLWGAMPSWETKIARTATTPRQFAEFPGVASCYTKMLQNCGCSSHVMTAAEIASENAEREGGRPSNLRAGVHRCGGGPRGKHLWLGPRAARAAARRVLEFRFVGITELWHASVCLWHRRVGAGAGPRADELAMYRVGSHRASNASGYDARLLDGYVDREDELVYAAALRRFEDDLDDALGYARAPREPLPFDDAAPGGARA